MVATPRSRPAPHLRRHRRDRQLHPRRRRRLQDPVGGLDADAPPRGADRQADLRPRRPRLAPHRGRRAAPRLCPPHGPPRRRDGCRLRRHRAVRQRPPRHPGRLCRPLPARGARPLLPVESAGRGFGHLRAVAGTDPAGQGRRRRSRHRHQLRRWQCRGDPPGAAALGRLGAARHADQEVLPLALSKPPCMWRDEAIGALTGVRPEVRVLYQSANASAISAAVAAGLTMGAALFFVQLRPGQPGRQRRSRWHWSSGRGCGISAPPR